MKDSKQYIQREISWLSFNGRVLQEAEDTSVPLIERIKFLGIFSSNLDEFFRVRVSALRKFATFKPKHKFFEYTPDQILDQIYKIIRTQQKKFGKIYRNITACLAEKKIFIIDETQLSLAQGQFVRNHFQRKVLPMLAPIMISDTNPFPYLKDKSIYLAVRLSKKNETKKSKHALIEIPTDVLSRFILLPKIGDNKYIILLDDVIRYCLKEIF